ncbi:phage portal protein [Candidatus Palauibacter sp.]|uniref:phage portal protein n=1 Tax=Candidatus Palauibacter sp. TaxID=3101350 RepID=UPI003CC52A3B
MAFRLRLMRWMLGLPYPDPEQPNAYTLTEPRRSRAHMPAAIPAAYAAVGLLSSTLAQLPRTVGRLLDPLDDYWEPDPDHPVTDLLERPSRLVDPWLFWEWMFRCLYATGNAYAWIRRDGGVPVELVPSTCRRCEWVDGAAGPVLEYELELWGARPGMGDRRTELAGNVVALHGPGFNGWSSPSPIRYAASRTLDVMDQATEHQRALLAGVNVRAAIKVDPALVNLEPDRLTELQKRLEETYAGARKAGKIPVLPPGFDLTTSAGLSATDLQLVELLKWGVEDVARVYGIPPRMLGHYHEGFRATRFEAQAVDFERYTVRRDVRRAEEQLTAKLMTRDDVAAGRVVRMPSDRIRAGSWSEQVTAVDQAVAKAGVMTVNEGRRVLRLPERPDGDRLYQPKGAPAQDSPGEKDQDDAA